MNGPVSEYSRYSALAQASYATLKPSYNGNPGAFIDALRAQQFTTIQAETFSSAYAIRAQATDQNTGFSATVFQNRETGEFILSFRGTELSDIQDVIVDGDLALNGVASRQILAMLNFYLRLITPEGQHVEQYEAVERTSLLPPEEPHILIQPGPGEFSSTYLVLRETATAEGLGIPGFDASTELTLAGHSLGGHLAMAFTRMFPTVVQRAYTYNTAGVNAGLGDGLDRLLELLAFITDPVDIDPGTEADGRITNIIAEPGRDIIPSVGELLGEVRYVFIEDQTFPDHNHSIRLLTDSLAVYELLSDVDPDVSLDTATAILEGVSSRAENSLEDLVSRIVKLFDGGAPIRTGDGNTLHEQILSLRSEIQGSGQHLVLKSLHAMTAEELVAEAKTNLAYRYALQELNTFVIEGDSGLYALHNASGELNLENFGEAYLADRAAFLLLKARLGSTDRYMEAGAPDNISFADLETGLILVQQSGTGQQPRKRYVFGTGGRDAIEGDLLEDHLYGGEGDDVIAGGAGQDYIEGNGGNDVLRGDDDSSSDMLHGGTGDDTYLAGHGDWISDSDGIGRVVFEGAPLTGGTATGNEGAYQSDDGRITYTLSGTTLVVNGAQGTLTVENFLNLDLGIVLQGEAPSVDPPPRQILGDFEPVDFDPSTPGVQVHYDELGNVITDPTRPAPIADELHGSARNDEIVSGLGADVVLAGNGDDSVDAGEGQDRVDGEIGDDIIAGGGGTDLLSGGVGNDRIFAEAEGASGGQDRDWLSGGAGDDLLVGSSGENALTGGPGADHLVGEDGNDSLMGDATLMATDFDWSYFEEDGLRIFGPVEGVIEPPGGGDDVLDGGAGDDWIRGGVGDDVVYGGEGFDDAAGEEGNDTLFGGAEDDTLQGDGNLVDPTTHGDDYLDGGEGNDDLSGDGGSDVLLGGDGDDILQGDRTDIAVLYHGDDYLDGGAGDDVLVGAGGGDTLVGGLGSDRLDGDAGNIAGDAHGNDTLLGLEGDDVLIGSGGDDKLSGGADNDQLFGDASGLDVAFHGIDYLEGEGGDDLLVGGGNADTLFGGDGNDELEGDGGDVDPAAHGSDYLDGGAGDDELVGGGGADVLKGGPGSDTLFGDVGGIDASYHGDDNLDGGDGDDLLVGLGGDDTLLGSAGNDRLHGDGGGMQASDHGDDTLDGGEGNDYLVGYGGSDTLRGGTGDDELYGDVGGIDGAYYGNDTLDGGDGQDLLVGSGGDDTLLGRGGDDRLHGDAADTPLAFQGADFLFGGNGDDVLSGYGGDDFLDGGTGVDALDGGLGNDQLIGGSGDDGLFGREGDDVLEGGDGVDSLFGGSGADILDGGNDNDFLRGQEGDDVLAGGAGHDQLQGDEGHDELNGGLGDDRLDGGEGDDVLVGGAGDDYLVSGPGNDILEGGEGHDLYVYNLGDGTVTLRDSGSNTLRLGAGIGVESLRLGLGSLVIQVGDAGEIRIDNFDPDDVYANVTVDTIEFADGTVLNHEQLLGLGFDLDGTDADDVITGTQVTDRLRGFAGNDVLIAKGGNDVLDGGVGADRMEGGEGDDTYIVDDLGDVVIEQAEAGIDRVETAMSYALGEHVENLTLTGDTPVDGTGNALDNFIEGNSAANRLYGAGGDDLLRAGDGDDLLLGGDGNDALEGGAGSDVLDGGTGHDYMAGGAGDDIYRVDAASDVVQEGRNAGQDTVESHVTYTLGADLENLTLLGASAIDGTGNSLDNVLTGNDADNELEGAAGADVLFGGAGNDILVGGLGSDFLAGGLGDDLYRITDADDVVSEQVGEGLDTVESTVTYSLGGHVENLVLTGFSSVDGIGNGLDNLLAGNDFANRLDGAAGADRMEGRRGNDTYVVDDAGDMVIEEAGAGTDSVESSVSHTLAANVENLILTGDAAVDGGGNEMDNMMRGNSAANQLQGQAGNDVLHGGEGEDSLLGGAGEDAIYGESGADYLSGGDGNDLLDGGLDGDQMAGGAGDDQYRVDNASDLVIEGVAEGHDTVSASVTHTLGDHVEDLRLVGSESIDGTGNDLDNQIIGNAAGNSLAGRAGDDLLDGQGGADSMAGGAGDDTYVVDESGDSVTEEAGDGTDTVQSSVTFALGANVENLTLTGTAAVGGTGNDLDNTIVGNDAGNALTGGLGNDYVDGAAGNDTLFGNDGDDYLYGGDEASCYGGDPGYGGDIGYGGSVGSGSTLGYGGDVGYGGDICYGAPNDDILYGGAGEDVLDGGTGNDGLYGEEGVDTLLGGSGNDLLDGGEGIDLMVGGLGDDLYVVDGICTSTGGPGNGRPHGNEGVGNGDDPPPPGHEVNQNDPPGTSPGNPGSRGGANAKGRGSHGPGGAPAEPAAGQGGDPNATGEAETSCTADEVVEEPGAGYDIVLSSVTFSLPNNVEELRLTGEDALDATGSVDSNLILGNDAANRLAGEAGNDLLMGGAGGDDLFGGLDADLLIGGLGDDVLHADSGFDVVAYNRGDGQDSIEIGADLDGLTLSVGGGVAPGDLYLSRDGDDLLLGIGDAQAGDPSADGLRLENWFTGEFSVPVTLQLMMEPVDPAEAGIWGGARIQTFDLNALVEAFEQTAAGSGVSQWELADALLEAHLAASDDDALGGDLAYRYGVLGAPLDSGPAALATVSDPRFGREVQGLS